MFFQNFQAWKLHSWQDYMYFFLMAFSCFAIFYFMTKMITKRRNDAFALKRVAKKLKGKNCRVYNDVVLDMGGQQVHYDHLLIDAVGIVAIRSIGWGIRVYGSAEDETWKVSDNKKTNVPIENPVRVLRQTFEPLRRLLSQGNIYGVSIEPLTVFADPFAQPELYLGRDSCCVSFAQLNQWRKLRKLRAQGKNDKVDVATITAYLDTIIVEPKTK